MEWAFSNGLTLLRGCSNDACDDLSFADLRAKIEGELNKLN